MSDDVLLLFMVVVIVYNALTGRLSGGYTRKENPIYSPTKHPPISKLYSSLVPCLTNSAVNLSLGNVEIEHVYPS